MNKLVLVLFCFSVTTVLPFMVEGNLERDASELCNLQEKQREPREDVRASTSGRYTASFAHITMSLLHLYKAVEKYCFIYSPSAATASGCCKNPNTAVRNTPKDIFFLYSYILGSVLHLVEIPTINLIDYQWCDTSTIIHLSLLISAWSAYFLDCNCQHVLANLHFAMIAYESGWLLNRLGILQLL